MYFKKNEKNYHKIVQHEAFILVKNAYSFLSVGLVQYFFNFLVTFITYEFWTLADKRTHQFSQRIQSHAYTISVFIPRCIPWPINYHPYQYYNLSSSNPHNVNAT